MGKLERESNALKGHLFALKRADEKAGDFNKILDGLVQEIRENLSGSYVEEICTAVEALKDKNVANETDANVNGAISNINKEIDVINSAIRMQKEAARQAKLAVKGGNGSW